MALLRPGRTLPFDRLAGTPPDHVANNYLAIPTGSVTIGGLAPVAVGRVETDWPTAWDAMPSVMPA